MKTLEELANATDDELRVMLALLDGYTDEGPNHSPDVFRFWRPNGYNTNSVRDLPNYTADLNACAPIEHTLEDRPLYHSYLVKVCGLDPDRLLGGLLVDIWTALPRQRTIALILTLQQP